MKTAANRPDPETDSFLGRCDPRVVLIAFFTLMPLFLTHSVITPSGDLGVLVLLMAMGAADLDVRRFWHQIRRLRWFFLTLFTIHAWLTPGTPLIPGLPWLSQEGVGSGFLYGLRLLFMLALSWVLIRTTPASRIVAGVHGLFGFIERIGIPLERSLALLTFTLNQLPSLFQTADEVGKDWLYRRGKGQQPHRYTRLRWLALAGESLLYRLIRKAGAQEEALRIRGFAQGLPPPQPPSLKLTWRDAVVLLVSSLVVLLGYGLLPDHYF